MTKLKHKKLSKDESRSHLIDISVTIKSGMVHWPGDPAIRISSNHSIRSGDAANTSRIDMGSHTGTHMDSPYHFIQQGNGIDRMPLDATVGKARVIEIHDRESIGPRELKQHSIQRGERILFKTMNSSQPWEHKLFVKNFISLSVEAARFLAARHIKMVGIDYLSVGENGEGGALTHKILLRAGIWIIEGLYLSGARSGEYELICLPLKLYHGDGAPARAILRPIES